MLSRLLRLSGSILHGPSGICAFLFAFLTGLLLLLNHLIFVDAEGVTLVPANKNIRGMGPVTRELIELTQDIDWAKNPEKKKRVLELNSRLTDPERQNKPYIDPVPYPVQVD